VPTLVLDDGEVVDGSDQIAAWARAHRSGRLGRKTARGFYDYD
jgi:3-hydroxyacyl-CoA dehydrogenase